MKKVLLTFTLFFNVISIHSIYNEALNGLKAVVSREILRSHYPTSLKLRRVLPAIPSTLKLRRTGHPQCTLRSFKRSRALKRHGVFWRSRINVDS